MDWSWSAFSTKVTGNHMRSPINYVGDICIIQYNNYMSLGWYATSYISDSYVKAFTSVVSSTACNHIHYRCLVWYTIKSATNTTMIWQWHTVSNMTLKAVVWYTIISTTHILPYLIRYGSDMVCNDIEDCGMVCNHTTDSILYKFCSYHYVEWYLIRIILAMSMAQHSVTPAVCYTAWSVMSVVWDAITSCMYITLKSH